MGPAQTHELAELVADLTLVIDVMAPPRPIPCDGPVGDALLAFEHAWSASESQTPSRLVDLGTRIAAAGMALMEGDPLTVRRLIAESQSVAGAA